MQRASEEGKLRRRPRGAPIGGKKPSELARISSEGSDTSEKKKDSRIIEKFQITSNRTNLNNATEIQKPRDRRDNEFLKETKFVNVGNFENHRDVPF